MSMTTALRPHPVFVPPRSGPRARSRCWLPRKTPRSGLEPGADRARVGYRTLRRRAWPGACPIVQKAGTDHDTVFVGLGDGPLPPEARTHDPPDRLGCDAARDPRAANRSHFVAHSATAERVVRSVNTPVRSHARGRNDRRCSLVGTSQAPESTRARAQSDPRTAISRHPISKHRIATSQYGPRSGWHPLRCHQPLPTARFPEAFRSPAPTTLGAQGRHADVAAQGSPRRGRRVGVAVRSSAAHRWWARAPRVGFASSELRSLARILIAPDVRRCAANVVGDEGFEPSTPSLSSWCSSQLS